MESKPKYKVCRRLGSGVYEKCQTPQYALSEERAQKNNKKRPKSPSDFGKQLLEKQRVRTLYGISERQFRTYIEKAGKNTSGDLKVELLRSLESRLDNVAYRLNLAPTRRAARQMVSHGHLRVNGTRTTVPSYSVREGDVVSVRDGSKSRTLFLNLKDQKDETKSTPSWLSFDMNTMEGKVTRTPKDTDLDMPFDFRLVLEFYSR